ncbi:MAG: helix-turn-helix domain-containing protein [Pseudomonadota bacterium]
MSSRQQKRIGFLAFEDVQALDLFGPIDAFHEANDLDVGKTAPYEIVVITFDGKSVAMSNGTRIEPQASITDCPPLHTLIIPGGQGSRAPDFPEENIHWIRQQARYLRRYGSICTGLYILARTGLADGYRVATHWHHAQDVQEKYPKLSVDPEALFIRAGKLFTAAGVSSGIDLALALIEDDLGPKVASDVARHLVVYLKRPGDQRQFSSVLQRQTTTRQEFAELIAWIADNLSSDLSSFLLAERVGLSERQFRRRFAQLCDETPTQHIERMRIEAATQALLASQTPIERIAREVGYSNADTFRRAFERLLGIAPSVYRERFGRRVC